MSREELQIIRNNIKESDALDLGMDKIFDYEHQKPKSGSDPVYYPEDYEPLKVKYYTNNTLSAEGEYLLFSLAGDNNLYTEFGLENCSAGDGDKQHSSVTPGVGETKITTCAGYLSAEDGKITWACNDSGHFQPKAINFYVFVKSHEEFFAPDASLELTTGEDVTITTSVETFLKTVEEKLRILDDLEIIVYGKIANIKDAIEVAKTEAVAAQALSSAAATSAFIYHLEK
jgi:hypothetical protein